MLCCCTSFFSSVYAALSCCLFVKTRVQPKWHQHWTPLATITKSGCDGLLVFGGSLPLMRAEAALLSRSIRSWQWSQPYSSHVTRTASHKWLTEQQKPGRGPSLPCEHVDFQGKLLEQECFGGVGQDQDNVHVPWPQAHQVTGVVDVR